MALIGVTLSLAACSSAGTSSPSTASAPGSTHTTARGTSGADSITIQNFAFSPTTLTVAPGATVTVTNKDRVSHTLTASRGEFNTGDIPAGQSKTLTAPNSPGTYSYICSIHQYMSGSLIVSG